MGDSGRIRRKWKAWLRLGLAAAAGLVWVCAGDRVTAQAPSTGGVRTMLIEPPTPLLPAALGKLKRAGEGDVGDGLGKVDAADAPVLKEDGLRRYARSDYTRGSVQENMTVYEFNDASGAIAAYDYFRKPEMRPEKLGAAAVSNADELLMRSGVNVVVEKSGVGPEAMAAAAKELIAHLPKVGGTAAIAPLLPGLLPAKGLDADSVKYALGPEDYKATGGVLPVEAVGFDKNAETVTAKYKGGGVLTLLLYPTPEIAGVYGRAIEAAMKQDGKAAGTVKLHRNGTLLALTTGPWTASEAQKMVDGVHLQTILSIDKPVPLDFHTEVQKTYTLLQSVAIFSGLGALAAVVLGVFFGFGRAAIRVLQGKPAATEPEFLRIDLREAAATHLKGPEA